MTVDVTACLVTRGDVDMEPIVASIPHDWEVIVWDNEAGKHFNWSTMSTPRIAVGDLAVYGRYAAIQHAAHDVIFVQDDDCLLPPDVFAALIEYYEPGSIVANMSDWHQQQHAAAPLIGFGAMFDRDLPAAAFARWDDTTSGLFLRTCDVVFAALTPSRFVNVPFDYLPQASAPDRMSRQDGFAVERQQVLDRAIAIGSAT